MQNRKTRVWSCYPNLDIGAIKLLERSNFINKKKKEKLKPQKIDTRVKLFPFKTKHRSFYIFDIQKLNAENFDIYNSILSFRHPFVKKIIFNKTSKCEDNENVYLLFAQESFFEKRIDVQRYQAISKIVCFAYIPGLHFLPGFYYSNSKIKKYKKAS